MTTHSVLLQGGTLLIHGENDHVKAVKADLLIEGDTIAKIEANVKQSAGTQVIDCTDKIISPGFIDTHHDSPCLADFAKRTPRQPTAA